MRENQIQHDILQYLQLCGALAWRNNAGKVKVRGGWMNLAPKGAPDIIAFLPAGQVVGVEVKDPDTGKLSSGQRAMISRLIDMGHTVIVATDVEDVARFVKPRTVR